MKQSLRRLFSVIGIGGAVGVVLVAAALLLALHLLSDQGDPAQRKNGKVHSAVPASTVGFGKMVGIAWEFAFNKPPDTAPTRPISIKPLTHEQLLAAPDRSLFRLGHSTLLLKLRGEFWLTDPVFSERASPVQWMGPRRFHPPPIAIAELPPIKVVILSHDHYDHLDHAAILQLAAKTEYFLAPLGVGDLLMEWGITPDKVRQFDWWQGTEIDGLSIVATPARHFSGRGLFDSNKRLWASWVIIDDGLRLFFSGDSGYFDGFKAIGDKYGPFDVTFMETGAYDKRWPYVHMQPAETLQAHLDLKGRWLLPIHNGTFDLAMHPWTDPFERITKLGSDKGVAVTTPCMGELLDLTRLHAGERWWTTTR